uniref:Putative GIY-YIG homing endonuclease n=1 Tax=Gloeotilopsis planctonica TaxID=34157 RepID=A0A1B2RZ85_9CHLO|nr:putative GIY-YIG homing endonuclease [Gloeotilopsis planctonica]
MTKQAQKNSNDVDNSLPSSKLLNSLSNTKDSNLNFLKVPFHFNAFFQPGIYAIVNTQTKKRYIGEANNLANRLSDHFLQLNAQKHNCAQLQKDWLLYGESVFDFVILEMGVQIWSDRIKRLKAERQYIQKYRKNLYNILNIGQTKTISKKSNRVNNIPIKVNDELFTSISEASRHFEVSISTVRSRLNSSKYPN